MTEWWQQPYDQGDPVPVPGFPRPLFPPDADGRGRQPSSSGPDVEAYKRGVWRAGRWPGPATRFDRSYSNGFAHGTGGNVVDTGVAGFQRQSRIDDTGWIGQPTFQALRTALVPAGNPHAGEPVLDALAQNLIAEAWQLFAAVPPPAPTVREAALAGATRWLGYTEQPAESNHTTFGQWYGVDYQPYCAIFVTYAFEVEAGGSPSFVKGSSYAYVPYIVADARAGKNGLTVAGSPIPGDLVCYDWARDGTFDHVGFFEDWAGSSPSSFTAIEANTSPDDQGSQSNGGGVYRRTRDTRNQTTVFVRVAEP